ncbi:MAG: archaeosortase/exosortase family protein [Verrucomicrobiota bacterium]
MVSWFLHAPVVSRTEEAIHLLHHHLEIAVTLSCSGFGYYSLLAALCLGRYFGTHPFCPLRGLMFLTSLWVLALGANAARIICAVYARLWASSFLPSAYQESLHLMVGISVFLFSLITIWILFPRFVR